VFGEVDTVDPEPDPERTTAAKFELRSTLARLQSLAEVDRAAVIMRAFNGCSYLEIAAALQISEAAAKVKVHRARRYLAEHKRIK